MTGRTISTLDHISDSDRNLIVEIAARMVHASSFEDRMAVTEAALASLGATALNAAFVSRRTGRAIWMYSTLDPGILGSYVDDEFWDSDFIMREASQDNALIWSTDDRAGLETTDDARDFAGFVRDSGTRFVQTATRAVNADVTRCLTYLAEGTLQETPSDRSIARIDTMLRLLLPWLEPPETATGPRFVPFPNTSLAPRETQALRLLAGGLKNARIADAMGITEATVAKHLASARQKLDAKTREEAVARAVRDGMIRP